MNALVLIALLLAQIAIPFPGPGSGSAPIATVVQATSCTAAAATCTTSAISVTLHHTIAFCTGVNSSTATVSSITISTGTDNLASFTSVGTKQTGTSVGGSCYYILSTSATGSTTFQITWSAGSVSELIVYELSGVTASDGTATSAANATGITPINCPAYTTTNAHALYMCAVLYNNNPSSITPSGGTIQGGGSVVGSGGGAIQFNANLAASNTPTDSYTQGLNRVGVEWSFAFH